MGGNVAALAAKFDKRRRIVITGHGAWHASFEMTKVPQGITLSFYSADGTALSNTAGQEVDGFSTGKSPVEVVQGGATVKNYKLYPAAGANAVAIGGFVYDFNYLALGTHPKFDANAIVTTNPNGVSLSELLSRPMCKTADVHWSCCRSTLT